MPATIPQPKIVGFPDEYLSALNAMNANEHKENTTMTTAKTAAKSAKTNEPKTTKKEKTMIAAPKTKNEQAASKPIRFSATDVRGQDWIGESKAEQDAAVHAVRAMYGDGAKFMPRSLYKELTCKPGAKPGMLNRDVEQLSDLGVAAHDLGWEDDRFLTVNQVTKFPGAKIKAGAFEFLMVFPAYGKLSYYYVVNVEDVEWPNGVPTSMPKAEPKPKTEPKAEPKAKATRKQPAKKAAPSKDAELEALRKQIAEVNAQLEMVNKQNEQLAATQAATANILAGLAAKMGIC